MFDDPRSSDDARDRGAGARDRDPIDPRDAFVDKLDLPRGTDREMVLHRDREYTLRDSESRTLSIVGAFRVVSSRDLRDHDGQPLDPAKATSVICANRASFGPRRWMAIATLLSS